MFILSQDNSDTRYASKSILKAAARAKGISPTGQEWSTLGRDSREILEALLAKDPDHLVFTFWSEEVYALSQDLQRKLPDTRFYAHLDFLSGYRSFTGSPGMPPGIECSTDHGYQDYLADALILAVEAIREFGPDRDQLKLHIPQMKLNGGRTGTITFDKMGNRADLPESKKP